MASHSRTRLDGVCDHDALDRLDEVDLREAVDGVRVCDVVGEGVVGVDPVAERVETIAMVI